MRTAHKAPVARPYVEAAASRFNKGIGFAARFLEPFEFVWEFAAPAVRHGRQWFSAAIVAVCEEDRASRDGPDTLPLAKNVHNFSFISTQIPDERCELERNLVSDALAFED
jgi:hypothetical protein